MFTKYYLYDIGLDINLAPPAEDEEWINDESTIPQIKEFPLNLEVMFQTKTQNLGNEQQFDAMKVETNTGESIVRGETNNLTMGRATTSGELIRTAIDNFMKTVDASEIPATQYASGKCRNVNKP